MKKRERGILTVEASIVLTLMLLFILFLFSFARIYRAQNLVSHAALQSADAVALESYLRETALQSDTSDVVYLASHISQSTAISAESLESLRSADLPKIAKEKFVAAIAKTEAQADEKLRLMGVKDGLDGVDFSECQMDLTNDDVIVALQYTVELQFPVLGFKEITVTKAAKAKTFGEILFEVSTAPNHPGWGTTAGDANVVHGSTVEISAKPSYGYEFVGWSDGVTENPRKVTVDDAEHYVAIFEKSKFGINIGMKILYNTNYAGITHSNYGAVTGAGTYEYQDTVTITATPAKNYQFAGWDDNNDGKVDNTSSSRTITVEKTYSLKAIFKPAQIDVSVKSNNGTYGSAQISQGANKGTALKVEYGSIVQLLATPKDSTKYIFTKWSNNNTQPTTTVTVKEAATYEATFGLNVHTVTFYNGNTVVHTTTVIHESSVEGSAPIISSSMYSGSIANFSRWAKHDDSTFNSRTKVCSDLKVYAKIKYTVTLNAKGGNVIWTSKTEEIGKSVALPTPTLAYHTFAGWQTTDGKVYTEGTKQAFNKNITLTAKWICSRKIGDPTGKTYEPYCSDIYSGGKLKAGATLPYREYQCNKCGEKWNKTDESLRKHRRMNYKDGFNGDDFNETCNKKHPDTHYGYCGKYYSSSGRYHTWNGHYHVLCSYCHKEEQGFVWCYVDGKLVWYNLHRCAVHGSKGNAKCPF